MSSSSRRDAAAPGALIVEPDEGVRSRVSAGLREQGLEVSECGDMVRGRELYRGQGLVITPLNGNNGDMREFVAWLRAEAGTSQPWIIAMGANHRLSPEETPGLYGVNDLVAGPLDTAQLVKRLEAAAMDRTADTDAGHPASRPRAWREASMSLILEHFAGAAAVLDRSMMFMATNRQWFTTFGVSAVSLTGHGYHEFFADMHPDWRQLYERCLATGVKECRNDQLGLPGAQPFPVRWEIQGWREPDGSIGGLVVTCAPPAAVASAVPAADFTSLHAADPLDAGEAAEPAGSGGEPLLPPEEPQLEMEVREPSGASPGQNPPSPRVADAASWDGRPHALKAEDAGVDAAFREMAEAAPFGMVLLNDEAQVIYANPQHRAALGIGIAEAGGLMSWLKRALPRDEELRTAAMEQWRLNVWQRHNALTCSLRTVEGLMKDIEFRPAPLTGDRVLLTIFDVTDARLDEHAIRTSEIKHRGLFQHSSAAFAVMNAAGHLSDINPAFEALTGCTKTELRRSSLADFLPPEAMRRLRPADDAANVPFSTVIRHRSGRTASVRLAVSIIRNEQGHPVLTGCTFLPMPGLEVLTGESGTDVRQWAGADWGSITPDLMFVLDDAGLVISHNHARDFASLVPPGSRLHGQFLERALPLLTSPLPLDLMMERLLDDRGHEVRCVFQLTLPGEAMRRSMEARMLRLREPPAGPAAATEGTAFGLAIRDLTGTTPQASDPGAFLHHLRTPAVLTTDRGRILRLNPAAEALFGYTSDELKTHGLHRLFQPEDSAAFCTMVSGHLSEAREWCATAPFTRKDGRTGLCRVELTRCVDETTAFQGLILLIHHPAAAAGPSPA